MERILGSGERGAGLAAAVESAMTEQPAVPIEAAVQLPLMPAEEIVSLPAEAFARRQVLQGPRGPGRPIGAVNKSTEDWRRYLLAKYPSPLQVLCETYSRPVGDLVAELGCTRLEAFKLQIQAAAEAAPYLHGKMPVEIKVSTSRPLFIMADPDEWMRAQGATAEERAAVLADLSPHAGMQLDQRVIDVTPSAVAQSELHSSENEQADQALSADASVIADHAPSAGQVDGEGDR